MKKTLAVALGSAMLLSLCACGGGQTTAQKEETPTLDLTDGAAVYEAIRLANDLNNVVDETNYVVISYENKYGDGSQSTGEKTYYLNGDGTFARDDTELSSSGNVARDYWGTTGDGGCYLKCYYSSQDAQGKEFKSIAVSATGENMENIYGVQEQADNAVFTAEEKEDSLVVTVREDVIDTDYNLRTYTVDPDTLLLKTVSDCFYTGDSEEPFVELNSTYAYVTDYAPAEENGMTLCEKGEDTCQVTVVYNPGEEGSRTVTFTTAKDVYVGIDEVEGENGNSSLYSDEACTQRTESPLDLSSGNVTVYVK